MKKNCLLALLACLLVLSSCDGPSLSRVNFDSSFPRPNKDLSLVLGKNLTLKNGADTLELAISSSKESNLITEVPSGDTVFYGKVSKFRGLYYFSQAVNDTSYLIHAVKISDDLVYGLGSVLYQTALIDEEVRKGRVPMLIKYVSPDSSSIRLHPEKKELRKLYSGIISKIIPDTLLQYKKKAAFDLKPTLAAEQLEAEEAAFLYKVYPNPISDYVKVELEQPVDYRLLDINGTAMITGNLSEKVNTVHTAKLKPGVYLLVLTGTDGVPKGSARLLKH